MREIKAYVTSDGVVHDSYQKAKDHAEKRYGDQLTAMAHELVKIDKYTDMIDRLDGYKGSMELLLDLAADHVLHHDPD